MFNKMFNIFLHIITNCESRLVSIWILFIICTDNIFCK